MKVILFSLLISSSCFAQADQNEKIKKFIFLAQKQFEKGNESKTYDFIDQAIAIKSDSCELYLIKSDYYFKFQRMVLAIESIEKSIAQFSQCKELYDQKIFYHEFLGDSLKTIQTIQLGISNFKDNEAYILDFYLKQAYFYLNIKAWNQSLASADSAWQINNQNAETNRLKGYLMFKMGNPTQGLALIKSNLNTNANTTDFLTYAQCLIENNETAKAQIILDSLLNKEPENFDQAEIYNLLGSIQLQTNDLNQAELYFQNSIMLNSGNAVAYKNLALTFMAKKQFEKVCTNLKKALYLGYTKLYGDEVIKLAEKHCR